MLGTLAWLFFLLAFTSLIVWVVLRLIHSLDRIKITAADRDVNNQELNVLSWLKITYLQIMHGEIKLEREQRNLVNMEEEQGSQLLRMAIGEDGIGGDLQPTTNLQFSVDIPANTRVILEIKSQPGIKGEQGIFIDTKSASGNQSVQINVISTQNVSGQIVNVRQGSSSPLARSVGLGRLAGIFGKIPLESILFGLSLLIYLVIRLVGLDRFPIYFFTDEAVHTVLAEDLVQNHFRFNGTLLPTYFSLGASYGLNSVSVYLQVIPYLLFGKSVFVTRAVSVFVSLLGAAAVGLTLKDFVKARYWWTGVLILSATPVWFYHSRTAFENVELAAFYAIFIYFYLCYRLRSPKWLFLAIIAGALAFYTHGLGQFLIAATAGLLFLIDLPYHWRNKKIGLLGLGLIIILTLPYLRFSSANPAIFEEQMRMRGAYWLEQGLSLPAKFMRFGTEYLHGLNPLYWFIPNPLVDLARHQMKGYGYILSIAFPFFMGGLWLMLKNLRSPVYRTVLITLLVSPLGAALAQITVLRVIWFVIPAAILTSLGLDGFLYWLEKKRIFKFSLSIGVFLILLFINLYILQDALRNGPTWYKDYSLYGMQYGAKQLFGEAIPKELENDPNQQIVVTPIWANGTDNLVRFFLSREQQQHVRLDSIKAYLFERLPLDKNVTLVLTESEYQEALASPKFKNIVTNEVLYYPDGSPGFYFVQLDYSEQADKLFADEKLARSKPVEATILVDAQPTIIRYSQIDMGQPEAIFDGDVHTLMRGLEANPFVIELVFQQPRTISQINADLANMDFTFTARLIDDASGENKVYEITQRGSPGDPHVELLTDNGPDKISRLRLEIFSLNAGAEPHIHIREIKLIE